MQSSWWGTRTSVLCFLSKITQNKTDEQQNTLASQLKNIQGNIRRKKLGVSNTRVAKNFTANHAFCLN
jgi:hypothetical protein